MSNECIITGTVIGSAAKVVKVETNPIEACASCGGRTLCTSGKVRVLELETEESLEVGNKVELAMTQAAGALATFFLYAASTAVGLVIVLLAFFVFEFTELAAAVLFIAVEAACFILASRSLGKYLKSKITIKRI